MSKATSYATNSSLSIQAIGETDEDQLWAREWVRERVARAEAIESERMAKETPLSERRTGDAIPGGVKLELAGELRPYHRESKL